MTTQKMFVLYIYSSTCHSFYSRLSPSHAPLFLSWSLSNPCFLPHLSSLPGWCRRCHFNVLNERFGREVRQERGSMLPFLDQSWGQITPPVRFALTLRRVCYVKRGGCVCVFMGLRTMTSQRVCVCVLWCMLHRLTLCRWRQKHSERLLVITRVQCFWPLNMPFVAVYDCKL